MDDHLFDLDLVQKEKLNATEESERELCLLPLAGVKFRSYDLQPIPPQPTITLALESYLEHIRSECRTAETFWCDIRV